MGKSSIKIGAIKVSGTNTGAGVGLYAGSNPFNNFNFKSLVAAGSIDIISGATSVTISGGSGGGGSTTATNGLSINGSGDVVLGGTLTGDTVINTNGNGIVIGSSAIATGSNSRAEGQLTRAVANGSHAEGFLSCAYGQFSHAEGLSTIAYGLESNTQGVATRAYGTASHAEGSGTRASGNSSHAEGIKTFSVGEASHTSGYGRNDAYVFACGFSSFNHSRNTTGTTDGYGANANSSAILGGLNHHIASGNTGATIIGGNTILLTGTTYIDTTAVDNLAIMSTPTSGSSQQVLIRNTSTGKVEYVSKASLGGGGGSADGVVSGATLNVTTLELGRTESLADVTVDLVSLITTPSGSDTQIQFNNAGSFGADADFSFSASTNSLTLGTRCLGAEGAFSFTQGFGHIASGSRSVAFGYKNEATNFGSFAVGLCTIASGALSSTFGSFTNATGSRSHASGYGDSGGRYVTAGGNASFIHSRNGSFQTIGHGALAIQSAILGGIDHNIEVGNINAAIIGGCGIKLTGTSYIDTTAVDNLAIMSIPISGNSSQILARNTSTGVIEYTTVSGGGGSADGVVSGGTLNGSAILALSRTEGLGDVNIDLTALSGGTGGGTGANGICASGSNLVLGGGLTGNTYIDSDGFGFSISNNSSAGGDSAAFGSFNCADFVSFAVGCLTVASGASSASFGYFTKATGDFSHAEGGSTSATGTSSHAEGTGTTAGGIASHSEGCNTFAEGNFSHAEGFNTNTIGAASHAEGCGTIASGIASHAEGSTTTASGGQSHAEGLFTTASDSSSHAEGFITTASAQAAHSEGLQTYATGIQSHTEGFKTYACGAQSHSQNFRTKAIGKGSHSGGYAEALNNKHVVACGCGAFNHSYSSASQTNGHGANAIASAILGGMNHNITIGNSGATIIGGNNGTTGIKLTGTQYVDHTAVGNLAIFTTPIAGGADDVLTWNITTKKVGKVTQGSISDGRLKTNLKPIDSALEGIIALNGYEYEFNELMQPKEMVGKKKYGLIAQEVKEKFPLVVNNNLQFDDALYMTVEYRELVPVLVEAIKELTNRLEILENI